MSELSPETRALIALQRDSAGPTLDDRKRIRERLMLELGTAAFTATASLGAVQAVHPVPHAAAVAEQAPAPFDAGLAGAKVGSAAAGKLSLVTKLLLSTLLMGGAGALLWPSARPPAPVAAPPAAQSAALLPTAPPATAPAVEAAPAAAPPPTDTAAVPAKPRRARVRPSAEPAVGSLAEELALLSTAQAALRGGDAERSLRLAREHAARFPSGSMRDERLGIEALSRCALGEDGSAAAAAFLREASGSPLTTAVRKACKLP